MATPLSQYPALRILVPFSAGILIEPFLPFWFIPLSLLALAIGLYLFLNHKTHNPEDRLRRRSHFILPLAFIALALGWLAAIIHEPARIDTDKINNKILSGRIVNLEYTDFSMRLTVDVLDNDLPRIRVLVSTRGCDYTMRAGDLVAWPATLHEVSNLGNPDEMDYAAYLLHNDGIRYQQHLPVGQVKKIGYSPTFLTRLSTIRRNLELQVFNTSLSPSSQQFVVALLLGNKSIIDKSTRQDFVAAGVAHILALSGLHVGFIALIIWWLLFPLDYLGLKKYRLVITLASIALFAVFTGLSPSVVRATVMIGFVFASLIFHRRSISLNALAMAALIILVFNPSAIYGAGFQLSFITVGAILLFAHLPQSLVSRFNVVNRLTTTVIASLVAMLATIALTAHYFHTVSLMSVLANLLILPVLPAFLVLGALFLLVTAAGMQWQMLNGLLDAIYRYIHWVASATSTIPGSHISGIYVSTFGVIVYFVIVSFVILWLYRHSYRYLLIAGCALVVLLTHSLWTDARTPRQGLVVFSSFTSTPIMYYSNGTGYAWIPDDEVPDSTAFSRFYAGFMARQGISELKFITSEDSLRMDNALITPPYAHLMGKRLLAAGRGRWKSMSVSTRLPLDAVIITKRFHGSVSLLCDLYRFKQVVISGAHQESARLRHECDSLGLEIIEGYYRF